MKISIIANCQATPLRRLLERKLPGLTFAPLNPVHLLKKEQENEVALELKSSDVIITQPIHNNYQGIPIGTEQISETRSPNQIIIKIPNLHFEGYHPNFTYIKNQANQTVSPRNPEYSNIFSSDYHDALLIAAKKIGLSIENFREKKNKIKVENTWMDSHFSTSLTELRKREQLCDITVSSFIESNYTEQQLFWTFNHPSNALLDYTTDKIIEKLNLPGIKSESPIVEFLASEVFPIIPPMHEALGLKFTPKDAKIAGLSYEQFIDSCWNGYAKAPELIEINSSNPKIRLCTELLEKVS